MICTERRSYTFITGQLWSLRTEYFDPVSALFFKRFFKHPFQIASIVPSSKALVERVGSKMDFSRLRVIAEYGPVEGVHSRGICTTRGPGFASTPVCARCGLRSLCRMEICPEPMLK